MKRIVLLAARKPGNICSKNLGAIVTEPLPGLSSARWLTSVMYVTSPGSYISTVSIAAMVVFGIMKMPPNVPIANISKKVLALTVLGCASSPLPS